LSNYGIGSYGIGSYYSDFPFASPYALGYRGYGFGPYPYGRSSVNISVYARPSVGYVLVPSYQPSYGYADSYAPSYGVPGFNSEYSHQPLMPNRSGRFDETYSGPARTGGDLRPGMVLPDGSRVISVGPPMTSKNTTPPADSAPASREITPPSNTPTDAEELPLKPAPAEPTDVATGSI
jgi:hypothetical protein